MPSPLGAHRVLRKGQTVPPKYRHHRGEVHPIQDRFSSFLRRISLSKFAY